MKKIGYQDTEKINSCDYIVLLKNGEYWALVSFVKNLGFEVTEDLTKAFEYANSAVDLINSMKENVDMLSSAKSESVNHE